MNPEEQDLEESMSNLSINEKDKSRKSKHNNRKKQK